MVLCAELVTKLWTVHETCLLLSRCLRRVSTFMGLHLFSLVWPLRLNLPAVFTSAVVYQHWLVRCSDTTVTKTSSNFIGNNIKKRKEHAYKLLQSTTLNSIAGTMARDRTDDPQHYATWKWLFSSIWTVTPYSPLECSGGEQLCKYTAFISLGRLVLPWKAPLTRKKINQLTTVTDNWKGNFIRWKREI